ncbi:MAG TPA: PA14 domain-containing protein, partial [Tepidisphaeraceae bacterium]|nr:PA14 domain-containing protein [Tepidisphaeraceae bacterium]
MPKSLSSPAPSKSSPLSPTHRPPRGRASLRRGPSRRAVLDRACHEALEGRVLMSGGGWTATGLQGEYFNGANLDDNGAVAPSFTRRDLRLDFGQGLTTAPGGSQSANFASVPATFWSARWTGQFIPKFTETYTFKAVADDSLLVRVRPAGTTAWTTIVDQPSLTGEPAMGSVALKAGQKYDVNVSYAQLGGTWGLSLKWASPSTPEETIDPLSNAGINNPDLTAAYTDVMKGARNNWRGINNAPSPALDANGWPMADASMVWQESLNQGLDIDPLMRGPMTFSFKGSADVSITGNVDAASLKYAYDAATNTTTGSFTAKAARWNASFLTLTNARRDGTPTGPGGFTDLKLMRPVAPDAATSYSPNQLFTSHMKDALTHFTLVRHQLVGSQQREWTHRTLPSFFNQNGGRSTAPQLGVGRSMNNGASWEHKVMLANETGTDLMISLPTPASGRTAADTGSYLYNLALLLKYGSDGVNPYTGAAGANPVPAKGPLYPGLNANLNVYLELGNELWNGAPSFWNDYANLDKLTTNAADANDDDFKAINFDNLSTAKNTSGVYVSLPTWRYRMAMLRTIQASNIFRAVWGDAAMPGTSTDPRVRPLYEWQYDNQNETARRALTWADKYFNNANGQTNVADPKPVSYFLWGGGGGAYYGAVNGNGLTTLLSDSGFDTTTFANGYTQAPTGTPWTFSGTAGIARDGGTGDDIPPPRNGSQVGYVTDKGSVTTTVTFPATQTSSVYGVSFKSVNRTKAGATAADRQTLRVYLDYGTPNQQDITAKTFSQSNGYVPPGYQTGNPWKAQNVSWMWSEYYFTKGFNVTAGSTHTITFVGQGDVTNASAVDQTAFLEDVRVTSVDAIYAGGMPGGGEAAGQPLGQNIQNVMNNEASWAKAYGLKTLAYECGWSLGGDDGGSWVQLAAKYGDPRTRDVQGTFMDMFTRAGGDVNVFGTYQQWPYWHDFFAEQGLLDVGRYPIVQGIDARGNALPVNPTNGTPIPATLTKPAISLSDNVDLAATKINGAGGWMSFNVVAGYTGTFKVTTTTGTGGQLVVLADDATEVARGASGTAAVGQVSLTKGLHTIKVRSTSGAFVVNSVTVTGVSDVQSPTIANVAEGARSITVSWTPVAGAAGYVLRWGTARGAATQRVDAGAATSATLSDLTAGGTYYVAVSAYGADGHEGLPSSEWGVSLVPLDQPGRLARWEFNGYYGTETAGPVDASTARLVFSDLVRGPGLKTGSTTYQGNTFASQGKDYTYGADLAGAITKGQYYQFTINPKATAGTSSLSSLAFRPYFWDGYKDAGTRGAAVTYSTDGGATFSGGITASGKPSNPGSLYTADLSAQTALQTVDAPVTFRIYLYGASTYEMTGIGGSGDDIAVNGTLRSAPPANAAPSITAGPTASSGTVTGKTVGLTVTATDDAGEAGLTYNWSVVAKPAGTSPIFSDNGTNAAKQSTVTFDAAGTYTFEVTVADGANATTTGQVTVVVGRTLTAIAIGPATATTSIGGTVQFTASPMDQFGASMTVSGLTYALGSGSVGSIHATTGLYSAPTSGTGG